MPRLIYKDTIN